MSHWITGIERATPSRRLVRKLKERARKIVRVTAAEIRNRSKREVYR
jgi:hypothetical protein